MADTETTLQPYLTVEEVAEEIGCGKRNVYRLINEGELKAIKRSERKTVVARWALEAYQRKVNKQPPLITTLPPVDQRALLAEFLESTDGLTPEEFYGRFKSGRLADTSENMTLLVRAIALGAGSKDSSAPVEHAPWAIAAFTTIPDDWHS